jgi:hypothetical protein
MLICNRCSTSIPDGSRFCPSCGDPVTAADRVSNQLVPPSESVRLICPHCDKQVLYEIPSHGMAAITCASCARPFDTRVVRIRAKRSTGQKSANTRTFSVRADTLDGEESLIEFMRPSNEDFELRSRDLAAFSYIQGRLAVVQNLSVGHYMKLLTPPLPLGCVIALVILLIVICIAVIS